MKKETAKKKKSHIPFRMNALFFVVFLLFSGLIFRLGVVQIVDGEDYLSKVEQTEEVTVNGSVPRGKLLDRHYRTIVDNTSVDAITYTRYQGTTNQEMLELARKLSKIIVMDDKKVTDRDKRDFWILLNPERAEAKITEEELKLVQEEKLTQGQLYKMQVDRVTEKELAELDAEDQKVLAIYREMTSAKALTPKILKNENVTNEEVAIISENLESLPGIDVFTDWERVFPYDKTLSSIIGRVTDTDKGLPEDKLDYYTIRDYQRNDRVGVSNLEMQYEEILSGEKSKERNITDKAGNVIESMVVSEGQRGKDLVMTIDIDLQKKMEQILEEELRAKKAMGGTYLLDRAFIVMMDPNTGEVLSMAGKRFVKNEQGKMELQDFAQGTITTSYNVGSSVKGATVLMGYQTGAISPGSYIYDQTLHIKGTPPKGSYTNMGSINDLTALRRSSNVYMFMTAIRMGKSTYRPNQPLSLDQDLYDEMRYYYNQFGLGVRTGIDLPNESRGMPGENSLQVGKILDLSIGQYDTYTTMQMAQYVSTIANGGKRIQPRVVKEIREPSADSDELGQVVMTIEPKVLNTLDMKPEWIKRVQEGFRQVMQSPGGTASGFAREPYSPAGKTGTAESFYDGPEKEKYGVAPTMNLSLVAYAPHNNPEVAMAIIVPWAYQGRSGHSINLDIGKKAFQAYFELKENRQSQQAAGAEEETAATDTD